MFFYKYLHKIKRYRRKSVRCFSKNLHALVPTIAQCDIKTPLQCDIGTRASLRLCKKNVLYCKTGKMYNLPFVEKHIK